MDNLTIIFGAVIGIFAVIAIGTIFLLPKRNKGVTAVIFGRDGTFEFRKCQTIADIASFDTGGFDVEPKSAMKYSYGSTFLEMGEPLNRRASKPIFLTRTGDTSPMRFGSDNNEDGSLVKTYPMNKTEFNRREDLAAEQGRSNAARKITSLDPILIGLLIICVIMVVPLGIMGVRLAIQ